MERAAIVQEIRGDMLRALVLDVEGGHPPEAAELQAFRELCKDYESPGSLRLEALESRIQALENLTSATEVNAQRDTIMMGP